VHEAVRASPHVDPLTLAEFQSPASLWSRYRSPDAIDIQPEAYQPGPPH
jgi:hypothetical protein